MNWDSHGRTIRKKVVINGVTYDDSSIVEIVTENAIVDGDTIGIGTVVSAKCDVKIKTTNAIPSNAKAEPYICIDDSGVLGEWEKLGEFYIDDRDSEGGIINITSYDKLFLAQRQYVKYTSYHMGGKLGTAFPATEIINGVGGDYPTPSDIFNDICLILGVSADPGLTLNEVYPIMYIPYYTSTVRDVLSMIASFHGSNAVINKQGQLTLIQFSNPGATINFNTSNYASCKQINPTRQITYIQMNPNAGKYREFRIGSYSSGKGIIVENIHIWSFTPNAVTALENQIPYLTYTPIIMETKGSPFHEVGNKLSITLKDGSVVQSVILKSRLRIGIGMVQTIESPSNTDKKSEFGNFDITERVKRHEDQLTLIDTVLDVEEDYTELSFEDTLLKIENESASLSGEFFSVKYGTDGFTIEDVDTDSQPYKIIMNKNGLSATGSASPNYPKFYAENRVPTTSDGKEGDIWIVLDGGE